MTTAGQIESFRFATAPDLRFGAGAAPAAAGDLAARLGPRVLLISDAGLRAAGVLGTLQTALDGLTDLAIFDAVEPDPSTATLAAALAAARDHAATGILGLGGGSPMDVAKVTALIAGGNEDLAAIWGVDRAAGPRLPLALIPTTAGTGSEVTQVAILTLPDQEKRGVVSPLLLPDIAVLDPALTLGVPAATTAATGIDAMVHAIEAYTSRAPNANPLSRDLACRALRLLGGHIERAVSQPGDMAARGAMLMGAMLAGQAFANAPVAAVHALAYPIGGMFHIPHGLSNALVLAPVMRFNRDAAAAEYAALAPHTFPDLGADADAFIDRLAALGPRLGLPARLRDAGIPEDALPAMAAAAMKQTRLLVNNPREVTQADALAIYREAW
ncbi:MAG: iron-containing alcohol dehydrogenase [Pseudomonadota bacterium]